MDCVETFPLFEQYFLSCEMGLLKPDPNFFTAMVEGPGVPPEDCVFIDDTQPNVEAAKRLGIPALHFRGVDTLRQDLRMVL
jgi:HAD superfamily hydrolase (TIGR01509 family)